MDDIDENEIAKTFKKRETREEGTTLERFEKKCFALRTININFCLLYKLLMRISSS